MTPPRPDILTVRDAAILKLLHRLVDIGIYRKQWTAADVAHVVNTWLVPRQAKIIYLQPVAPAPAPEPIVVDIQADAPTVELPAGQYRVIVELLKGLSSKAIGEACGITEQTVKSHLSRAYRAIGVNSRVSAITAIRDGKVRVVQKANGNRGKKAS